MNELVIDGLFIMIKGIRYSDYVENPEKVKFVCGYYLVQQLFLSVCFFFSIF